jgi:predicted Zn-dependent protease
MSIETGILRAAFTAAWALVRLARWRDDRRILRVVADDLHAAACELGEIANALDERDELGDQGCAGGVRVTTGGNRRVQ